MTNPMNAVNFIFYLPEAKADAGKRLLSIMSSVVPRKAITIHRTIRGLRERFRRPLDVPTIAVIFISCRKELRDVVANRELLQEVPLVLFLPDDKKGMVAEAHSLRPRFLTYTDSDVREAFAVLNRMVGKVRKDRDDEGLRKGDLESVGNAVFSIPSAVRRQAMRKEIP